MNAGEVYSRIDVNYFEKKVVTTNVVVGHETDLVYMSSFNAVQVIPTFFVIYRCKYALVTLFYRQ
jgi:hypothetical protein